MGGKQKGKKQGNKVGNDNPATENYAVERIVDSRIIKGKLQYKVHWEGYTTEEDTWENESQLDCPEVLEEYMASQQNDDEPTNSTPKKLEKRNKTSKAQEGGTEATTNYEVERIVDDRELNGKKQYRIHWVGYNSEDETWEDESEIDCPELLKKYLKSKEPSKAGEDIKKSSRKKSKQENKKDDSQTEVSELEDEEASKSDANRKPPKKKLKSANKKGATESDDSESEDEEASKSDANRKPPKKKLKSANKKAATESDDSESEDEEASRSDANRKPPKKKLKSANKKGATESDDSESEDEEASKSDANRKPPKKKLKSANKKAATESDDSKSEDEETSKSDANRKTPKKKLKSANKKDETENNDGEYEVERILEMHTLKNGRREFLVKWVGFSREESTWEPEEHVEGTDVLEKFLLRVEKAKELPTKELRVNRRPTDHFTAMPQGHMRRQSRRHANKQRVKYYDAE